MPEVKKGTLAVKNEQYKIYLADKVKQLFGNKNTITKENLLKDPSIFDVYSNLSDEAKTRFDYILNLEDSSNKVTEKEYKILLCLLDANACNISKFAKTLEFDQEFSLGPSGWINVSNEEMGGDVNRFIDQISNFVTSRKEDAKEIKQKEKEEKEHLKELKQMEKILNAENKQREKEQKVIDKKNFNFLKSKITDYNYDKESDIIKMLDLLHKNNIENKKMRGMILKSIFGDNLLDVKTLRDGGTKEYSLNNGVVFRFDNGYKSPTKNLVAVIKDGESKWYNLDGSEVQ